MKTNDSELIHIMSEDEIAQYMRNLFDIYSKRKAAGELYKDNDRFPGIIIKLYYEFIERLGIEKIFETFKNSYLQIDETGVDDENELENVHSVAEQKGLYVVYNSIQNDEVAIDKLGVYALLRYQQLLFSQTPHPEFSGSFRTESANLNNASIELYPPERIPMAVSGLNQDVLSVVKMSNHIQETNDYSNIIKYINECVKLHCKLIQIHPFRDGNGRTTRALMNALFKLAGIPPVYVKPEEKKEYHNAMEKAIAHDSYDDIYTFFRYKVCDSIIALDLSMKKENEDKKIIQ